MILNFKDLGAALPHTGEASTNHGVPGSYPVGTWGDKLGDICLSIVSEKIGVKTDLKACFKSHSLGGSYRV